MEAITSADFIIKEIKVNIYSILLQLIIIPIPILISNVTKNIIFPSNIWCDRNYYPQCL